MFAFPANSTCVPANRTWHRRLPWAALAAVLAVPAGARAQGASPVPLADPKAPYLDPDRGASERAADLVSRMTLDEKVTQLTNDAAAIPRLGVPQYEWWNEALHGVARAGSATVFPQAIGLAATFDPKLMLEVATAISDEGRAKHHEFARRGERARYQGLTFWSPNINIFRDPRWGRGQETYGEDPFLTARMGVAFVQGLQGNDPKYLKVSATAKHFAVHSGPEADRHHFDARPSERDLYETYLPAFQALVQEAKVESVMGAYNRVNGESASASPRLLQQILRKDWGFDGHVVSDCGAIEDIYKNHKIVKTVEEAAAYGIKYGCDLECGKANKELAKSVAQGLVTEQELDVALVRLFKARFRLGLFDPPERVAYARIPYSANESAANDALARRTAQAAIVLLKNDGLLPLSRASLKTVAVVGPNADDPMTLLGNYYGTPSKPVNALAGIRAALPDAKVIYARGADLVEGRTDPRAVPAIEPSYLRPAAGSSEQGLRGEYFPSADLTGAAVLTRVDPRVEFRWDRGSPTSSLVARGEIASDKALPNDNFSVRWTGQLLPPATGTYEITVTGDDGVRLWIDGKSVIDDWTKQSRAAARMAKVELAAGKAYEVKLEYNDLERDAEVRLGWRLPNAKEPFQEALDAAKQSDVVLFFGGLTGDVEGEEMKVPYPGFAGGDRTSIDLPSSQQKLLEALHATGKPVVLVLIAGSALSVNWAQANLPAIALAWYPGQRGGNAIADVLFGDANPAGRLPVTFYRTADDLPPFDDYGMEGKTYRYFHKPVLYPFGHGLSYTKFSYADLLIPRPVVKAGEPIEVSVKVKNTGTRAGDEVVQLYVKHLKSTLPMPVRSLRGFSRVALQPGEEKRVTFTLTPSADFAHYDVAKKAYAVEPGAYGVEVGASSGDLRLTGEVNVAP
jgi:beta-glucosidase